MPVFRSEPDVWGYSGPGFHGRCPSCGNARGHDGMGLFGRRASWRPFSAVPGCQNQKRARGGEQVGLKHGQRGACHVPFPPAADPGARFSCLQPLAHSHLNSVVRKSERNSGRFWISQRLRIQSEARCCVWPKRQISDRCGRLGIHLSTRAIAADIDSFS
jgi:hypothetical protein